ncbi:hypothetical protein BLJ79_04210 [Arthrobacter sp. UCD-GKA]|uniref:hypothetical protein n=1 Tax=Arthrobacter sp. UCD-GKA TaxID=1913576 RepID=UPI0008DCAD7B|nr:hypothetical protein [Arthrobacter sp. UCD-GKA]OIH86005.1 hypothetical protein BLJ79_04210 [Arthrobacter sp. UCD-GKA]
MSNPTPTLGHVRTAYICHKVDCRDAPRTESMVQAEFDRAIAKVRAEAKAEALREAAAAYGPAQISGFFPGRDGYTKAWLNHRADEVAS